VLLHFVLFDLCSPVSAANFGGNGIVDVLPPHSACHAALLPVYFFLLAFLLSVMSCLWPPLPILLPNLPCCLQALLSACLPYSPCTCLPLSVVLSPLLHVCPSALLPSRFVARLVACLSPACWFLVACPPCYLPLYSQPVCLLCCLPCCLLASLVARAACLTTLLPNLPCCVQSLLSANIDVYMHS